MNFHDNYKIKIGKSFYIHFSTLRIIHKNRIKTEGEGGLHILSWEKSKYISICRQAHYSTQRFLLTGRPCVRTRLFSAISMIHCMYLKPICLCISHLTVSYDTSQYAGTIDAYAKDIYLWYCSCFDPCAVPSAEVPSCANEN